MKYLSFLLIICLACNPELVSFRPNKSVGKIFYENQDLSISKLPVPNVEVFLTSDTLKNQYIEKTSTDFNGDFNFQFFPEEKKGVEYFIKSKTTINNIAYSGIKKWDFNTSDTLTLNSDYKPNTVLLRIEDEKGILNKIPVYIFINENQANSISEDSPIGNIFEPEYSDKNGNVLIQGLPKKTYYFAAKISKSKYKIIQIPIVDAKIPQRATIKF